MSPEYNFITLIPPFCLVRWKRLSQHVTATTKLRSKQKQQRVPNMLRKQGSPLITCVIWHEINLMLNRQLHRAALNALIVTMNCNDNSRHKLFNLFRFNRRTCTARHQTLHSIYAIRYNEKWKKEGDCKCLPVPQMHCLSYGADDKE